MPRKVIRAEQPPELETAELIAEIQRRALIWCVDNPKYAAHRASVEALMMIGASVALEQSTNAEIVLQAWQESFGTTQLTHAVARLQVAERAAKGLPSKNFAPY